MNDAQAKIIVALIGLFGTILGLLAGSYVRSRSEAVKEAKREQQQTDFFNKIFDEMKGIKQRLDAHNQYAEKFGDIEKSIVSIQKDIEYIRKGKS